MKSNLIIVAVAGVLISCGNENLDKEKKEVETTQIVEESETLSLDNGSKWTVNAETHQGMTQIQVTLENMDPLTLDDFNLMGDKCDEQTSFIISNCSMKGEPHNQLHHVLHPILNDISNLQTATELEDASAAMTSLENNITAYFKHFEL